MLTLKDKFLRIVSNSFGNNVGAESFNDSRLPIYISNAMLELSKDISPTNFALYKKEYGQELSSIVKSSASKITFSVDDTSIFVAGDNVCLVDNLSKYFEVAIVAEIISSTSMSIWCDAVTIYNMANAEEDASTFNIFSSLKWDLDNAVVYKTASTSLHKLISLNENNAVTISESTGIGTRTIVDIEFINSLSSKYEIAYTQLTAKYQESPSPIAFGLI
jgi:hypothetical protein